METAIYKKSNQPVTVYEDNSLDEDWYLIQFSNGSSINCHKNQLDFGTEEPLKGSSTDHIYE